MCSTNAILSLWTTQSACLQGITPLHYAVHTTLDRVGLLLQHGADVTAKDVNVRLVCQSGCLIRIYRRFELFIGLVAHARQVMSRLCFCIWVLPADCLTIPLSL